MPSFFRAVAVDYDGTLAEDDRPHPRALTALAELRRRGRRAVLCTGRIMTELREVFPDVDQHFDAIVAENGGVVVLPGRAERAVNEPVPAELANALRDADVPVRCGMVLLATRAEYDGRIRKEITRLGLDAQLIRNRGELMVLPAGVTKGAGLLEALGELEVSRHSTVAIGDAENDHALLHACEVGVAVANAVDSLRQHADICLTQTDGAGVAAFLLGPLLSGDIRARPARWRIELGRHADGTPATLPGSRINVLVAGGSGAGKSYVAGILIERLSALGYAVCVFDCEGDHAAIQRLRGVVCVGGPEPLPPPAQLGRLIRNRFTSVVIDLSLLPVEEKRSYFDAAMVELRALRHAHGLPHWIVIEEADQLLTGAELLRDTDGADATGYCLVTHRPGALSAGVLHAMDAVIALPGAERYAPSFVRRRGAVRPFQLQPGHALLSFDGTSAPFLPGERLAPHVRHLHKYLHSQVPPAHRFFFAGSDGESRAAGNLIEFRDLVNRVAGDVLHHHLHAGDFSRWIYDVMADDELGARFRSIERWYRTESGTSVDQARDAIITAIDARYPGETAPAP